MKYNEGFGIIEIIIAVSIFVIIAVSAVSTVIGSFSTNRLGDEETEATVFAEQGLEAAKSIKNRGWTTPFLATNCATACGIGTSGSAWAWSGTNNVSGKFTRIIQVLPVQRNNAGNVVDSGGTNDPDTKKIVSTVNWNFSPTRNNNVVLTSYVSHHKMSWTTPYLNTTYNAAGTADGYSIVTQGAYMYIVRVGGNPDFLIFNISDPSTPVLTGSLTVGNGATNLFVSGNFAYIPGSSDTQELRIVNISNPAAPSIAGTYNATGTADPLDVVVNGTTAYLVKTNSGDPELLVLNVANPASISLVGSLQLTGTPEAVANNGNYLALASDNNNQELQMVNVTNPASPSLAGSFNASGNQDGWAIAYFGTTVVLGRNGGNMHLLNVANPASPSLVSTYSAGGNITGISMGLNNTYVYLATSNTNSDFQVVTISTPASPALIGSLNTTQNVFDLAFNSTYAIIGVIGSTDAAEFFTIRPG